MYQQRSRWILILLPLIGLAVVGLAQDFSYAVGGGGPSLGAFMPNLTEINDFVEGNGFAPLTGSLFLVGGGGRGGLVPGLMLGGGGWGSWITSSDGDLKAKYAVGVGGFDLGFAVGGTERSVLTIGALLGVGGARLTLTGIPNPVPLASVPRGIIPAPTRQEYDSAFPIIVPYVEMQIGVLDWVGLSIRAGTVWTPFEFNGQDEGKLNPPRLSPGGWYVRILIAFGAVIDLGDEH